MIHTENGMGTEKKKIFVLDTSVIIYDHEAITNFAEHDVAIPITVLEELDNFKKGNDTKNFGAREFIRFLDRISKEHLLQDWMPLNGPTKGRFRVILDDHRPSPSSEFFSGTKADNRILAAALRLQEEEKDCTVILVTKDIALRLKAKAVNLRAEDYLTGRLKDLSSVYSGKVLIEDFSSDQLDALFENGEIPAETLPPGEYLENNFLILRNCRKSALGQFDAARSVVRRVEKRGVYGIIPRNAEQIFAIQALTDPNIRLVSLQGVAGTGKTLIALASALEQRRSFRQIYVTRPIVPLSNKDMGYLPGDIRSKMNPYLEPLWDNLKFIKSHFNEQEKEHKQIEEMLASEKIEIIPLTYIRGRSLSNVFFIVDEAQNLTPHEVKTIITRAGQNTKLVFTGDIHQIDTPYLDAHSNGLSYMIDRLKNQKMFAHVTLEKGERSELANLANELL